MPENYICGKCGKVAKTKQALERHAAYHEDERPFSCEVCLQRFKNSDDRGKHYRRLKKDGKFNIACTVCHKHFKTQEILKKHTEMLGCSISTVDDSTSEEATNSECTTNKDSEVTVKEECIPGDGISCTCKICEMEFVNTKYLKRHYKEVHNDTKRQVCIKCGQTLSSKDSLARHFSIFHQTSFPYSCDVCSQKFKVKESLYRHVKFVHQDGGYQCPECNRVFTQPVNLRKHLAVHSTQKEYACKFCGREFRWKQALQKHVILHGNQKNSTTIFEENTEEGDAEFDVDLTVPGSFEEKKVDKSDSTVTKDVTEKYSSRKLKNVTEKDIGRKLMYIDLSAEETVKDELACKKSNTLAHWKNVADNSFEDITLTAAFDNVSECSQFSDVKNHSCSAESVGDENNFQGEKENCGQSSLKCSYDSDRHGSVRKRTFVDCNDIGKKKLKVSREMPTQGGSMSEMPANDDKRSGLNSLRIVSDFVMCNEDEKKQREKESGELEYVSGNMEKNVAKETGIKGLKFSSLTSCPTSKTKDAPKLVFRPSSIQNMMERSELLKTKTVSTTVPREEDDIPPHSNSRKHLFKFPTTCGSLHTKLHNPFLISNYIHKSTQSTTVTSSSQQPPLVDLSQGNENELTESDEKSGVVMAPPEHKVPCGKFSLVKHMLSLQNEENFDKTMFDNPLYSKPADIKDFEQMVERHKVVDKSGDSSVQYDLSAKQNIPFHWLGMNVAKKKSDESTENSKGTRENRIVEIQKKVQGNERMGNCETNATRSKCCADTIDDIYEQTVEFEVNVSCSNSNETGNMIQDNNRVHRGFQAIKNLVARRQKEGNMCMPQNGKSVISNPFDYQNKQYQDQCTAINVTTPTSEVSRYTHEVSSYEPVSVTETTEGNKQMCDFNRAANMNVFNNERNFDKPAHYRRQHSVDSLAKSNSNISTGFTLSRNCSETYITSDASSSCHSFSRSFSIPSYSDRSQKQWPLMESTLSECRPTRQEVHTITDSFGSSSESSLTRSGRCSDLVNLGNASHTKEETLSGYIDTRHQEKSSTRREIELSVIHKNIAQLQRLNVSRFDKNQLRSLFAKQFDVQVDTTRHCSKDTQIKSSPVDEWSQDTRQSNDRVTFSCGPVDNQSSEVENVDASFNETRRFDAYNMIDSPFGSSYTNSSLPLSSGHVAELTNNEGLRSRDDPSIHQHSEIEWTQSSRNYCQNNENRSGNSSEKKKVESYTHTCEKYTVPRKESKTSDVSIFDILKVVQERKGKEYDNSIESLLGAYI